MHMKNLDTFYKHSFDELIQRFEHKFLERLKKSSIVKYSYFCFKPTEYRTLR